MTAASDGRPRPGGDRLTWRVDRERSVLVITCRGAVSDDDLLSAIPPIWEDCPEVLGCDTLVDARDLTSEGGWTWPALREIARRWRDFAQGRDAGRRTAIVTRDSWVALLAGAFVLDYRGRRIRCFGEPEAAYEWMRDA